ncbi:MAG: bifunctional glutamate N-acetyltransferase/amino-acid acetyltransferase ArgJ [Endomicrobium sp.]|jgi:glutamate N-acetyltransferase/amino-acid N-acetyltransferase|nr:bifunctional glutamate N-acetyltransferase/amino-acid acetyltransferase ArgJ [Endomicrobium sp.]
MLPKGFKVGGIRSELSKKEGKKDLALFISDVPANTACIFTQNIVKAAPVLLDIERLKIRDKFSGVIANSGCANACTGTKGLEDAEYICSICENIFELDSVSLLCASTGVIGQYLNVSKDAFPEKIKFLRDSIGTSLKNEEESILAIMTTDTLIKKVNKEVVIKGSKVRIWGCVKGAGMIHPNLQGLHATMLSFILTDADIESVTLQRILEESADKSFNCVSIDGDTSTNDTVIVLANGQSGIGKLSKEDLTIFVNAFDELTLDLAKSVVKDGEGATKFIEIEVKNAKTKKDAKFIASTIATSPLFKTAMFGSDANWGRIIAAMGRSKIDFFDINKVNIYIGGIHTFKNGFALKFSENDAKKSLSMKEIKVIVDLNMGSELSKYYTCDFSYDYIRINGDYRS